MAEPRRGWITLVVVIAGAALLALAALLAFRSGTTGRSGAESAGPAVGGMLQGSKISDARSATAERVPVVEMQLPQSVTVGKIDAATYTITSAVVEPRNAESFTLALQVRMRNSGSYQANFWDRSFRLVTHDSVIAASSGLNALVEGRSDSAVERVLFVVPRGSVPRGLTIEFAGESTEVSLRLR